MRKSVFTLTLLLTFVSVTRLSSQELRSKDLFTGVCYAGTKVNRIYIPPPKEYMEKKDSKGGASIVVTYTSFPVQAKIAMEYAVSILRTLLPPDADIQIHAAWKKITQSGVLGNSSIGGIVPGSAIDALEPDVYYPVTLAEKIAGKTINGDYEADLDLEINSSVSWYFGTDGNTPIFKYDLVTVVLHELFHGLGFFDSMDVSEDGTYGLYGFPSVPVIYDTFIENVGGENLTDTLIFENNSAELLTELTGNQLYFKGPLTGRYLSGSRPKIYAPSEWDPGSSISHLDEVATLTENSLMTPYIDLGEAIHDPGRLILSILGDLGWINTKILHDQLKDTEEALSEVVISATIRSDTLYNHDLVRLVYSFDGFETSDTISMLSDGEMGDTYSTSLTIPSYNVRLQYYIFTEDDFSRVFRMPSLAEKLPFSVFVGTDTVKPAIVHTPNDFYFNEIDSIRFEATVTDNIEVDTVYVEYRVNEGTWKYFGLDRGTEDLFSMVYSVRAENLEGGDSISYRIIGVDNAAVPNAGMAPDTGYYTIRFEAVGPAVNKYSTDFTDAQDDFYFSGFGITQPVDFAGDALHSEHPYKSPEDNELSFNFYAVLRNPVIYDASGLVVSFNEIVLVEPGESGSTYGSEYFYDYVIVEGSKDYGKSWFSLADGYDSRILSTWVTAYNSLTDGQNSTYIPDGSMLNKHIINADISDQISPGETLMIRFRLFSDPFANGWGWVIDDLMINPLVDAVEEVPENMISLFPNPGNGIIGVKMPGDAYNEQLFYTIFNSSGMLLTDRHHFDQGENAIDISGYPPGLYFVMIHHRSGVMTFKYTLVK